ncbi:sensor histidine kinase [Kurthia sibirica]|uniref:histidine kinase n=1 Tax=Kurthia sibirica TaxID=202750 RepID=A0A2U3AM70_9BACL|nr:sensor histidine kinase [Kurthia sibirica]PWI25628.1 sensor histidine kinase [Kurthia sibirica]GEK34072.1 sensor protein BceS [Kurthia sibirica]
MWLFLRERKAWIGFFIILQCVLNIFAHIDAGFATETITYLNSINSLLFILFLIWRFLREQDSHRALIELEKNKLLRPFDEETKNYFLGYSKELKDHLNEAMIHHAEENDRILAWIHDIKTPLTAQKLLIDAMSSSDPLKKRLEIEWLRTYQLIDQELYGIRIQSIHQDNKIEEIDVKQLLKAELAILRTWCMEKDIGINVELASFTTVLSDTKWTVFIIRQILTNAVKYSNEHAVIHIKHMLSDRGHVKIAITDEGIGIPAEDLPRIFQKSFTGTVGRKRNVSTGMGLYLAKQAADELGIHLDVRSKVGEGTTVTLQFPLENDYTTTINF